MGIDALIRSTTDATTAALAGEGGWASVSDALMRLVGARTNSFWVGNPAAGQVEILSTTFGAKVEQNYSSYYHKHDLWTLRAATRPDGIAFVGTELVADRELRQTEIYSDFLRPVGMSHLVAALVPLGGSAGSMAIGLHRPEPSVSFEESDRQALSKVLGSMRRALRMRHELRLATGAAQAALAGIADMGAPAVIVDGVAHILFANTGAHALLHAGRGLVSHAGRLTGTLPADTDAIAALVGQVAAGGPGGFLRVLAPAGQARLVVLATRPSDVNRRDVVILFLLDPAARRRKAKAELLQAMFGLTEAEALVAEAAAGGQSAIEIAAARGAAEATVRVQLRQVLAKAGSANLREFTAAAARLPTV